jgi:phospholipase/carboxylesterase
MSNATLTDLAWPHVYRAGSATKPVLLLLHGTGGNEQQMTSLADALDPEATVLAPRGQVSESGMLRWFRRHGEGVFDVDDVERRASDLAGFIAWARNRYELGDRTIVAVGFSNGANIALATALLHPEAVNRVIAFSGMYPLGEREATTDLSDTEAIVLNGQSDPMAPLASVTKLVSVLNERGAQVQQELRPGGHGIGDTDAAAAVRWLQQHG